MERRQVDTLLLAAGTLGLLPLFPYPVLDLAPPVVLGLLLVPLGVYLAGSLVGREQPDPARRRLGRRIAAVGGGLYLALLVGIGSHALLARPPRWILGLVMGALGAWPAMQALRGRIDLDTGSDPP